MVRSPPRFGATHSSSSRKARTAPRGCGAYRPKWGRSCEWPLVVFSSVVDWSALQSRDGCRVPLRPIAGECGAGRYFCRVRDRGPAQIRFLPGSAAEFPDLPVMANQRACSGVNGTEQRELSFRARVISTHCQRPREGADAGRIRLPELRVSIRGLSRCGGRRWPRGMSRLRHVPGDPWAIPALRGGAGGAFGGAHERVLVHSSPLSQAPQAGESLGVPRW